MSNPTEDKPTGQRSMLVEICKNCGLTLGAHRYLVGVDALCPDHEGYMDWDQGPGTIFEGTGKYDTVLYGTTAKNTKTAVSIDAVYHDSFGIIELKVRIRNKIYDYVISSDWAVREATRLINRRQYGKALTLLNKFKEVNVSYEEKQKTEE